MRIANKLSKTGCCCWFFLPPRLFIIIEVGGCVCCKHPCVVYDGQLLISTCSQLLAEIVGPEIPAIDCTSVRR